MAAIMLPVHEFAKTVLHAGRYLRPDLKSLGS
jgi:hypothetical protein